jgi:hypothetical protein
MKKLLLIKTIVFICLLCLIYLLNSCTQEETTIIEETKTLDVTIEGNSPEFWYYNAQTQTTTKYTQPHIVLEVHRGDVINAIGYGYTIDNSNNYNAPNVVVVGYITFKINGVVVANGIDTLAYLIQ